MNRKSTWIVLAPVAVAMALGFGKWITCDDEPLDTPANHQTKNDEFTHPANRNESVGWAFGRLIGVPNAPGSPGFSPYGKPLPKVTP